MAGVLTVTSPLRPPAPVFSLAPGTYNTAQVLRLTDITTGASIYYTTNGNTPSASSTLYTTAIKISATETVKAIAIYGGVSSPVASVAYTINPLCDIVNYGSGFTATDLTLNGGAALQGTALQLTSGGLAQSRSAIGKSKKTRDIPSISCEELICCVK